MGITRICLVLDQLNWVALQTIDSNSISADVWSIRISLKQNSKSWKLTKDIKITFCVGGVHQGGSPKSHRRYIGALRLLICFLYCGNQHSHGKLFDHQMLNLRYIVWNCLVHQDLYNKLEHSSNHCARLAPDPNSLNQIASENFNHKQ